MIKISEVISQLEAIKILHGDIPVYVFEESGAYERTINVNLIEEPSKFDDWQFPHVQISP